MRQKPTALFFFLITCISLAISLLWIQKVSSPGQQIIIKNLVEEALENVAQDPRYSEVYRKTSRLPKELKYILLWTDEEYAPLSFFENGQRAFIKNNCSVINCYVTSNRNFFNGDVTQFNAIAFNGRNMRPEDLPKNRSPYQKYIFFNMESADNYPVCSKSFDGFFNWTSTYRLDSDVPYAYILIRNNQGEIVGPKAHMTWSEDLPEVSNDLMERLENKSKAAAWFVSHCSSRSNRKLLVKKLQKALYSYGLNVDVYGTCGPLKCPRDKKNTCDSLLERDYFFYMSLENSFAEDYVTEKLLTALQHDTLPIVYGGADYSRFLPPGSYLDANMFNGHELAALMNRLIKSPKIYSQYFRWKSQYIYSEPSSKENVCAVCEALNKREMVEKETVYKDFRRWWHPNYVKRCS